MNKHDHVMTGVLTEWNLRPDADVPNDSYSKLRLELLR